MGPYESQTFQDLGGHGREMSFELSQIVSSLLDIEMTVCLRETIHHIHHNSLLYVQCPFAFDARSRSDSALRKSFY